MNEEVEEVFRIYRKKMADLECVRCILNDGTKEALEYLKYDLFRHKENIGEDLDLRMAKYENELVNIAASRAMLDREQNERLAIFEQGVKSQIVFEEIKSKSKSNKE